MTEWCYYNMRNIFCIVAYGTFGFKKHFQFFRRITRPVKGPRETLYQQTVAKSDVHNRISRSLEECANQYNIVRQINAIPIHRRSKHAHQTVSASLSSHCPSKPALHAIPAPSCLLISWWTIHGRRIQYFHISGKPIVPTSPNVPLLRKKKQSVLLISWWSKYFQCHFDLIVFQSVEKFIYN